jgi:NAD+ kinase
MKPIKSFGIIAFKKTSIVQLTLERIIAWSNKNAVPIFLHPFCANMIPNSLYLCESEEELLKKSEALVSVGGDGTFLSAVHLSHFSGKPVIGINTGGIGFLTVTGTNSIEQDLERLCKGDYSTYSKMLLEARIFRNQSEIKTMRAINDIYINRGEQPKLISIKAWFGSQFITEFLCDGIIIATSSGSTAYSLAAGGPIVEPSVRAFILTPICPHSLTERSLILPCDKQIKLTISGKISQAIVSADGLDNTKILKTDEILISYAGEQSNLLQLYSRSYFDLLRTKLGWGKDLKSYQSQEE